MMESPLKKLKTTSTTTTTMPATLTKEVDTSSEEVRINLDIFYDAFDPLVNTIQLPDIANFKGPVQDPIEKIKDGKIATQVFNKWLKTTKGQVGGGNQKPMPFIYDVLKKSKLTPNHLYGECLLVSVAKVSGVFKCTFMNNKGSDSYIHHVALAANAISKKPIYTIDQLLKVSHRKNKVDALSFSHLCGNGSCARPGHLVIEPKRINDERTMCHTFFRRCTSIQQTETILELCPHQPKCFVNIYVLNKPYY